MLQVFLSFFLCWIKERRRSEATHYGAVKTSRLEAPSAASAWETSTNATAARESSNTDGRKAGVDGNSATTTAFGSWIAIVAIDNATAKNYADDVTDPDTTMSATLTCFTRSSACRRDRLWTLTWKRILSDGSRSRLGRSRLDLSAHVALLNFDRRGRVSGSRLVLRNSLRLRNATRRGRSRALDVRHDLLSRLGRRQRDFARRRSSLEIFLEVVRHRRLVFAAAGCSEYQCTGNASQSDGRTHVNPPNPSQAVSRRRYGIRSAKLYTLNGNGRSVAFSL